MNNTNTILGQLLDFIPRSHFQKLVKQHKTEKGAKGFSSWSHFTTMLFAQLSGQSGLRSIEDSINQQRSAHYHLGISKNVKRSTIAYANEKRDAKLFEDLFYALLKTVPVKDQKHGFRFKNPLYSIDATTIDLCLNLFPWADFRDTKAGIKLSIKLDHRGKVPCFAVINNACDHESTAIVDIPLRAGDIAVFDRGYLNYDYYANLCFEKVYFVTRTKSNMAYTVIRDNLSGKNPNIRADEIIELSGFYAKKKCSFHLRRIVSYDPDTEKEIVILTNHLQWSAATISSIYKDRWQIELFFKAIKQNLRIKRFYGTSKNAVFTQIWIALIAYLLFCILKFTTKSKRTFTCFISVISTVAFQRRSLYEWFIESPPPSTESFYDDGQLVLI